MILPAFLLFLALDAAAQPSTGRITGGVIEARTGAPLAAVLVKVQATKQQAFSDQDGRFEIADVPSGPQTVLVSVVGYGLVRRDVTVVIGQAADITIPVAEGASTYVEDVAVSAGPFRESEPGVASQTALGSRDLLALRGVIADDPVRAVHAMPAVATGDDFQALFAVRGHGPRHVGIALDGIDSPLLFHTVRGVEDIGSLALINSDILESATLLSGAYPQRLGSHLGARLDFTTREPARGNLTARALLSGTAATTVWEGPLGSGQRGGWMLATRKSYLDWLLRKIDPSVEGTFGFADGQAKVTLNPSPHHTLQASVVGGQSLLKEDDSRPGPNSLERGRNTTLIGNLRWQFTPSARLAVSQQAYLVTNRYLNTVPDGRTREAGLDRDITWRATAQLALGGASPASGTGRFVDVGAQSQWLRGQRLARSFTARGIVHNADARQNHSAQAVWMAYRWLPTPAITVSPGARVERFERFETINTSPWLMMEWQKTPSTRLRATAGKHHQGPSFDQGLRPAPETVPGGAPPPVVPEEAAMFDLGVERRIRDSWRLTVTGYYRRDDKGLRLANSDFLVSGHRLVGPSVPVWANTLTGHARGVEVTLDRRVTNGISGWASYAYGHAQMNDARTGERYAADYDQTHTVNAYAIYRASNQLGLHPTTQSPRGGGPGLSARFRYGSNFPIQGYFDEIAGTYYIGTTKNTVRLPAYARLDVRADWAFTYRKTRLTVFTEVLNAFNRRNLGPADFGFNFVTGVVSNLVQKGFPLLPSAGVLIEF